jgi:hypothetical protein
MRASIIFILMCVLSIHFSKAQMSAPQDNALGLLKKETNVRLIPNPAKDIVYLESDQQVDLFTLTNKQGKIVYKLIPKKNQVYLSERLDSGFYLFAAYVDGVKIKKGIIKKI